MGKTLPSQKPQNAEFDSFTHPHLVYLSRARKYIYATVNTVHAFKPLHRSHRQLLYKYLLIIIVSARKTEKKASSLHCPL